MCFVNFEKAYVSPEEFCGGYCRSMGYQSRCYELSGLCIAKVKAVSGYSAQSQKRFLVHVGLHQGCCLSPIPFVIVIDVVLLGFSDHDL